MMNKLDDLLARIKRLSYSSSDILNYLEQGTYGHVPVLVRKQLKYAHQEAQLESARQDIRLLNKRLLALESKAAEAIGAAEQEYMSYQEHLGGLRFAITEARKQAREAKANEKIALKQRDNAILKGARDNKESRNVINQVNGVLNKLERSLVGDHRAYMESNFYPKE